MKNVAQLGYNVKQILLSSNQPTHKPRKRAAISGLLLFKTVFGDFFVNGDRIFAVEAGKTEVLFGDMGGMF